jgi:RAP1 GTPase activating protein 1
MGGKSSKQKQVKVVDLSAATSPSNDSDPISPRAQEMAKKEQDVYELHQYIEDPENFPLDIKNPPLIIPEVGFRVELGGRPSNRGVVLEQQEKHSLYYRDHFYNKEHTNYVGGNSASPYIVSVVAENASKKGTDWRILVRTKKDDYYYRIQASKRDKMLKQLKKEAADIFIENLDFTEVKEDQLKTDLLHMEDRLFIKAYRMGVVYCAEGQADEMDMFSNESGSDAFNNFLDFLGEKVKLKGYKGYNGGLDVHENTTGTHSYATKHEGFEIMFHVSTLLPHSAINRQQLERKRHIGNDVVVIVFQDGPNGGFNPKTISSKFNHVYAVVQLVKDSGDKPRYKFAMCSKEGVLPHGPVLPSNKTWEQNDEFRSFLLTKLINSERAAYFAPGFAQTRTRRLWLTDQLEKYTAKPK